MIPNDRKYTKNDEWFLEENGRVKMGITDYAQQELRQIVFVDLPKVGDSFNAGDTFGVVESIKAAADIYTQVTGKLVAINGALEDQPELINQDAYGTYIAIFEGALDGDVMDSEAYAAKIEK